MPNDVVSSADGYDPAKMPASAVLHNTLDPAEAWPDAAPRFGQQFLPHIFTVSGRYGVAARAYSVGDEALLDSRANAEKMRNEVAIMESLEARMRGTALLGWHVEPEETDNEQHKDLANKVERILKRTREFMKLRYALLEGIWSGRQATVQQFGRTNISGRLRTYIKRWEPRHGDKLVFRYDDGTFTMDPDQVGIRVGPGYNTERYFTDYAGNTRRKVEATQFGLAYWFDDQERKTVAVHKHIIEDGVFEEPRKAGNIHGIGIRSRIYWTWYAYEECLKLLLEYIERSALGIEIWRFPAHNPDAKKRAEEAAKQRGSPGRNVLLVPVPAGEDSDQYDVQIVEPGLGGIQQLKEVLHQFFGHKIKRYIQGQTLTSEAEATGMGSGVADAHMATYADIIRFDATNLGETMTYDIVRPVQLWNFPGSDSVLLRFVIDTEAHDNERKMNAFKQAWEMGAEINEKDVMELVGATMAGPNDRVLTNPALEAPPEGAQSGNPFGGMFGGRMSGNGNSQDMLAPAIVERDRFAAGQSNGHLLEITPRDVAEPTDRQKSAGNYKKAHCKLHGLPITIENPAGSTRKGDGWSRKLASHYGYIKRTEGADGDHVDCFIGPHPDSEIVFVVDQTDKAGKFDEHKVILGATNRDEARRVYSANYPIGWNVGPITSMTIDQFKSWLKEGNTRKKVEPQVSRFSANGSRDESTRYLAARMTAQLTKYADGGDGDRWITIGGVADPKKGTKHEGGTAVQVDKSGNITGGPAALTGKNLDTIDQDVAGTSKDQRKDNEPPTGPRSKASVEPLDDDRSILLGDFSIREKIDAAMRMDGETAQSIADELSDTGKDDPVARKILADTHQINDRSEGLKDFIVAYSRKREGEGIDRQTLADRGELLDAADAFDSGKTVDDAITEANERLAQEAKEYQEWSEKEYAKKPKPDEPEAEPDETRQRELESASGRVKAMREREAEESYQSKRRALLGSGGELAATEARRKHMKEIADPSPIEKTGNKSADDVNQLLYTNDATEAFERLKKIRSTKDLVAALEQTPLAGIGIYNQPRGKLLARAAIFAPMATREATARRNYSNAQEAIANDVNKLVEYAQKNEADLMGGPIRVDPGASKSEKQRAYAEDLRNKLANLDREHADMETFAMLAENEIDRINREHGKTAKQDKPAGK